MSGVDRSETDCYSRGTVIGATIVGAAFTSLAVGVEGLLAHLDMATASDPTFWLIPGVMGLLLALMYALEWESLPGITPS